MSYENQKGNIMKYRAAHRQQYNDYMRQYVNDRYYRLRHGKTREDVAHDKILCDVRRLYKRSYIKKT